MSKRLVLFLSLLVLLGTVELAWYLIAVRPNLPSAHSGSRAGREGPPPEPIPYRPSATPPRAARPTSLQPISYRSPAPAADALRKMMQGANVVIVVLDAARVDHVGCYGYPRDTTPNLDRLAEQSLVFEQHFCQYPQTTVSTASLFTGQYPDTHGLVDWTTSQEAHFQTIDPSTLTLEQALKGAGFETFFLSSNRCASPELGIGDDFQYAELVERPRMMHEGALRGASANPSAPLLVTAVAERLARRRGPRFFAYVHFLPPHVPYEAPEELIARYRGQQPPNYWQGEPAFTRVWERWAGGEPPARGPEWANIYDANLRWADQAFGNLEAELRKAGVWDNTLLIVTADHGEALEDHKYTWHAACPYDEAIHIPLLIRFPGNQGPVGRVDALTQTVDLMPTILDLCQVSYASAGVQGKSLLPLLTGEKGRINEHVFSKTSGNWPCSVVRDQHTALFLYLGGKMRALYDLDKDPWQSHNLIAEQPERALPLVRAFESFARAQKSPPLNFLDASYRPPPRRELPSRKVSDETRRQLRALGYTK